MGFLKIIKTLLGLEKEVKQFVETAKVIPTKEVLETKMAAVTDVVESKPKKYRKPKAKKQITK